MTIAVIARLIVFASALLTLVEAQGQLATRENTTAWVKATNIGRRGAAKARNISNMNELLWDDGLAESTVKLSCNWPPSYSGPGRIFPLLQQFTPDQQIEYDKNQYDPELVWRATEAFVHPLQTRVGCSILTCDIPTPKTGTIKSSGWCIMGPLSTPPKDHIKWGAAGSGCGSLKNNDGLCVGGGSGSGALRPGGSGSIGPEKSDSSNSEEEATTESAASLISIALPLITIFSVQLAFQ